MRTMVSTTQLWADYCRLGSTQAVADLHGYSGHANVVQRLRRAGYRLRPAGRRVKNAYRREQLDQRFFASTSPRTRTP